MSRDIQPVPEHRSRILSGDDGPRASLDWASTVARCAVMEAVSHL